MLDDQGLMHWPVLLFYPQASMYHDSIDDVCEADALRWVPERLLHSLWGVQYAQHVMYAPAHADSVEYE